MNLTERRLAQSANSNHTDKRHLGDTFASIAKEVRESGSAANSPAQKMFNSSGGASAFALANIAAGSPAVAKSGAQGGSGQQVSCEVVSVKFAFWVANTTMLCGFKCFKFCIIFQKLIKKTDFKGKSLKML